MSYGIRFGEFWVPAFEFFVFSGSCLVMAPNSGSTFLGTLFRMGSLLSLFSRFKNIQEKAQVSVFT